MLPHKNCFGRKYLLKIMVKFYIITPFAAHPQVFAFVKEPDYYLIPKKNNYANSCHIPPLSAH